jgi:outer membrane lipoprotein carrier protein
MTGRALFFCFLATTSWAVAQEPLPAEVHGVEKLALVVARVSQVQRETTTLTAEFEQQRTSRLLKEPSLSRGRMYFRAPDTVRWEYEAPRPMSVLLAGGAATTYRPAEKRAERVEFGRIQRRVLRFLGAGEPLEELRRYFSFTFRDPGTTGNYVLELQPTALQIKKRLASVTVVIDRDRFLPVGFAYTEHDGDRTVYTFSKIRRNEPIPDEVFQLHMPADVVLVELKARSSE